jgi:hypothetical protein
MKYIGLVSKTELEALYIELEEGEGGHHHYCSILIGDILLVDES